MTPFVHLHVHSQYSLLDGQASIPNLVNKAAKDGMPAIALTDHGNMFGIKEFFNYVSKYNKPLKGSIRKLEDEIKALQENTEEDSQTLIAKKNEEIEALKKQLIKPILGCECYVARTSRHDKGGKEFLSGNHLVVLAKNLRGYKNLIKMISIGWTEGFYGRPRIDKELLEKYHEGLIVSSACLGGEIPRYIMQGQLEKAKEAVLWYKSLFGEDYYIELQRHETYKSTADQTTYPKQKMVNEALIELAREHDIKIIATNDVHFVDEEDAEAHDRLVCLTTNSYVDEERRMRYTQQEWMKTTEEMSRCFADIPEALANTLEIADKIEYYSIDHDAYMPDFPLPENFSDNDDYLRHLTYEGSKIKYPELTPETEERIDFELETIKKMGFPGYFLIVQDFINAAKNMGVAVGPGRGSVAGSAVAYCLGITDIDPIKYDLLFERFLNPDRISMPDIDIDFDDDGRGEVLRWVTEKYGKEKVAHIITYGTMATKSAIKDVARVQRLPLSEANRLAKLVPDKIPDKKKITLRDAIAYVPELKEAAQSHDRVMSDTLKYAQMLEGNVRNTGVHACGIIIGKSDISDVVPVSTAKDKETDEEMLVTQYEGSVIEDTGLIKMDFLGLKTLSIIKEAIENIEQTCGEKVDISTISLEDPKTYELYSNGRTTGTFQFESAGMQKHLRDLQPSKFEDLIAMNALYRPGPMEYIPSFVNRKHGREPIAYDLPEMESYLRDTYGITVYQEQVMLLSRKLAGFTRGQSDELRKAMGKKLEEKMVPLKEKFLEGAKANGHPENVLEKIWSDWRKFAQYAFNKSHATCYSWVAYQTAYLKANYPSEYMAAVLSRNINNITEITKFMDECKSMGMQVLGPDVNESMLKFSVNKKGDIRFGLGAIKGVGENAVLNIVEARRAGGPFKGVFDFVERVSLSICNRKTIESLALSGAFDNFPEITREQFFAETRKGDLFIDVLLQYGSKVAADKASATNSLFGDIEVIEIMTPEIPPHSPWSDLDRLNKERDLVGIYLSAHPLDDYYIILNHACNTFMSDFNEGIVKKGKEIRMGGMVVSFREGTTKKGSPYGVVKIEDYTGSAEIPLFGNNYIEYSKYCKPGMSLWIVGSFQPHKFKQGEMEFSIGSIKLLPDVKEQLVEKITIKAALSDINDTVVAELSSLIKKQQGKCRLYFTVFDTKHNISLDLFAPGTRVEITKELVDYLSGNEALFFKID